MDINSVFPGGKFLKAADLQGHQVPVVIESVILESLEDGEPDKPVCAFKGRDKSLVLNKTNCNTISAVLGSETDAWVGKGLTLYPAMTDFQGRQVACIRVKVDAPPPATTMDPEDIPF